MITLQKGVTIESEFGVGKVVSITEYWIIHKINNERDEAAIYRGENWFNILADEIKEGD